MKKLFGFACVSLLVVTGCSEEETVDRTTTDATAETSVDTGVAETTPDTAVAADTAADSAEPDSADAATDAAPSDAGTEADCITTDVSSYFDVLDSSKCIVGRFTIGTPGVSATWGRHGGPLAFTGGAEATLTRYELPSSATGELTAKTQKIALSGLPSTLFWNSNAVDLPFFGWTGFAYTGTASAGEVFFVDSTGLRARYSMRGLFDIGGIAAVSGGGRLLYTGLSELATATPTTNKSALWAADSCGVASSGARLIPDGDSSCKAPTEIGTWKPATGSSGPIAIDRYENAFVVLNGEFGSTHELRGFERSTVAKGAAPAAGTTVVSSSEYFQNVAADGMLAYFRTDAWPATNLDIKAAAYTFDPVAKTLTVGTTSTPIKLKKPASSGLSMFVDSTQRLWIGLDVDAGDAGATSTVFFVVRDKKP